MLLKQYQKDHKHFFLLLKIAYQKKQKFFLYPFQHRNLLLILKKLQEKSLILNYCHVDMTTLQVSLRYDMRSLPAIQNIFLFPKSRFISIKTLKALTNDYPLSLSLVNTKFGILDTSECQKKNCGGELIVTIN